MLASDQTITTVPSEHHCSVGRYTHGLAEATELLDEDDVAALLDVGWLTMDALADVARLSWRPEAIAYGPLSEASTVPDVTLLRVNPRQMMEISDAVRLPSPASRSVKSFPAPSRSR